MRKIRDSGRRNWIFLDENSANQGFKDIIQMSQFVDLVFILREKCVKNFFYLNIYINILILVNSIKYWVTQSWVGWNINE